ncbi:hypothetical protein D3C84_901970 [compost metagenome]
MALQIIVRLLFVEHRKVAHQEQPGNIHRLHASDQGIHGQYLLHRAGNQGALHVFAVHRQPRRVQQTHHGAGPGNTLLDPLGIEKITGLGPQARAWSQGGKIVENDDDFVLAPQHFSHQRTAEAAHGTIEHHFGDRGFGVFHGCFPIYPACKGSDPRQTARVRPLFKE